MRMEGFTMTAAASHRVMRFHLDVVLPELPPGLLGLVVLALSLVSSLVGLAGGGILGRLCLGGCLACQRLGLQQHFQQTSGICC